MASRSAASFEEMLTCLLMNSSSYLIQQVHNANFSVGTNDPVFTVGALPGTNGLFRDPKYILSILRVDHFAHCRNVNGSFRWSQPKDAVIFVRIGHVILLEVPYPGAYVGNALGFFERAFAFLQIAVQELEFFLCPLALRDVLGRTEHFVGPSRRVSF